MSVLNIVASAHVSSGTNQSCDLKVISYTRTRATFKLSDWSTPEKLRFDTTLLFMCVGWVWGSSLGGD